MRDLFKPAAIRIAMRSILRRKTRMLLIGSLVTIGTFLIVFGGTFASSAQSESKKAIVSYFTGDLELYSNRSREIPSPFSFNTPLPVVEDSRKIETWLDSNPDVESFVSIGQNYGLISTVKDGAKIDLPILFYAVDTARYQKTFDNLKVTTGQYFGSEGSPSSQGVLLSEMQKKAYRDKYGVTLEPGQKVTLLSLTGGGSVNAVPSQILGYFEPKHYSNVFNYINFMDMRTYSSLFNFTGIATGSLPATMDDAFAATSDDAIFGLADTAAFDKLDVASLAKEELTGSTQIAIKLKDSGRAEAFLKDVEAQGFQVKSIPWNKASSFFASVADILQAVIYGATFLIFLIVVFILMNTLIINILERTGEIGTLRAIGADKSFVSAIFLWESILLNLFAAVVGISLSLLLIASFGSGGVQLPDIVAQYLVGGGPLNLVISPVPFLTGVGLVLVVSFLATLYPIRVAVDISPLKAMSGV
jgi:putative ABC transport system permease protein